MAESETLEARKPVYVPWTTFTEFLDHIKPLGLPPIIDETVMPGKLSRGVKSQLRSALKFLLLIDDAGRVRPLLRKLVEHYPGEGWAAPLKEMIDSAYAEVLSGLDLSSASMGMLSERFVAVHKAHGQVLEKAVRFFLAALKEAKVPVSGLLDAKVSGAAVGGVKRARAPKRPKPDFVIPPPPPPKKLGWIEHTYPLDPDDDETTVRVSLPRKLTQAHVKRLHAWLRSLAYD